MSDNDITHKEIYDRLIAVEAKVDALQSSTEGVVAAFNAAAGAFAVLEFLGKLAKPLIWVGGLATAIGLAWHQWRNPP